MKLIIAGLTLMSASLAMADTNTVRITVTNFVAAPSNIREVDGQAYDITKSVKWESFNCKFQKRTGDLAEFVKVDRVKTGEREAASERAQRPTGRARLHGLAAGHHPTHGLLNVAGRSRRRGKGRLAAWAFGENPSSKLQGACDTQTCCRVLGYQ